MIRKVNQIGPSTLMVSLPSKWAKKLGIEKGQELDVLEEGNTLRVRKPGHQAGEVVTFQGTDEGTIKRYLNTLYMAGCDEVCIRASNLNMQHIESLIEPLLGYEVIEHTAASCTIRDIAQSLNKEFDSALRRVFLINMAMGEECTAGMQKRDIEKLARTAQMERTNNKFTNFCTRILNKYGYPDAKRFHAFIKLISELEKVADAYRDICVYAEEVMPKAPVKGILKNIVTLFKDYYEVFYTFDIQKVENLAKRRRELHARVRELAKKKNTEVLILMEELYLLKVFAHIEYLLLLH